MASSYACNAACRYLKFQTPQAQAAARHAHGDARHRQCSLCRTVSVAGRPSVPAPAPCGPCPCPCGRSKARGAPNPLAGKWVKVKPRSAGWCGRFSLERQRHSRQCQCNAWGGGPQPSRVATALHCSARTGSWHGSEAVDCWRGGVPGGAVPMIPSQRRQQQHQLPRSLGYRRRQRRSPRSPPREGGDGRAVGQPGHS